MADNIMLWLYLTLIVIVIWTVESIVDKFVLSHDLKDPTFMVVLFGVVFGVILIGTGLIFGPIIVATKYLLLSLLCGVLYFVGIWFFYYVMEYGEVSRVIPMMSTKPVFVTLMAIFLFGEILSVVNYIGIAAIVFGAIVISYKKVKRNISSKLFYLFAFLSVLIFSIRTILVEYLSNDIAVWSVLFWTGIAILGCGVIVYIFHHPRIHERAQIKGVEIMLVTLTISAIGTVMFFVAIAQGSVSIVTALTSTMPLLVFIFSVLISKYHPNLMHEPLGRKVLMKKVVAIVIILGGTLLVFV
jgi:drug/metabolite transporter (DMT)-like permease